MDKLEYGKYYYCKKTNKTMRYDGWAMQLWTDAWDGGIPRVGWTDVPRLEDL